MGWHRAQSNNILDHKTVDFHYCPLMSQLQSTMNERNTFLQLISLYNSICRELSLQVLYDTSGSLYITLLLKLQPGARF